MAIAIRRWRRMTEASDFGQPTASVTRWRISALPSAPMPVPGIGRPRWLVELIRARAGECADFIVDACDEQGRLALPADLADRRLRRHTGGSPDGRPVPVGEGSGDAPPLILVGREGRKRVVVAADIQACSLGIQPGMAASMAQALAAGLVVHDADPAADAQALDRLALWLLRRYAPVVATDPPDGLMIDFTGACHLHGGEAATLTDMVERFAMVGIAARAAVAGTYGLAHALSRFNGAPIVAIDDGDHAQLVGLPVAALRLPAATIDGLRRLGFDRVGELAATPRAPLALRFGSDVGRRLDQMFGRSSEPFELVSDRYRAANDLPHGHADELR